MVQFTKLRVSGFKSFAETTELDILPGLTGIVGPNGCGKSNLVEALRWMMGETSAKSLRGGEMDDVIFAGTTKRPARNFAEVSLVIANPERDAPDPYAGEEQIDISRRIDRGMGSDYKINGKTVRAADSAVFFADSAAGAHSPSIVSQGRVTEMISAKPVDRRRILESAASISGLHNRRKEAETRLRAAEKNLTRVDDVLAQKTTQYDVLVKQAKQAERYRSLSDTIRRLEALTMAMEWTRLTSDISAAQASMAVANEAQNQAKQSLYELNKRRESLQAQWDTLERQSQDLQSRMQQQNRAKERAEEELQRYEQSRADFTVQLETLDHDREYEQNSLTQAQEKITTLDTEKIALEEKLNTFHGQVENARQARDEAKSGYDSIQKELNEQRAEYAALNAQKQMQEQQMQRLQTEQQNLTQEQERVAQILTQLTADLGTIDVATAQNQVQQLDQTLQATLDHVTQLEKQAEASAVSTKTAADALQMVQNALHRIDTEIKTLAAFAETPDKAQTYTTMLNQVTVQSGYEHALAVALGHDLRAGLDNAAPIYWQERDIATSPLPQNVPSLVALVQAPAALKTALSMIGIVATKAEGETLAAQLQPGQMLVSQDGYGWRWDGYTVTPDAQATAQEIETQQLLEQRNRLVTLRTEREIEAQKRDAAQTIYTQQQDEQNTVRQQTTEARNQLNQLQRDLGQARQAWATAQQKQAEIQARQNALHEKQQDIATRITQSQQNAAQVKIQLDAMQPEAEIQHRLHLLQTDLQKAESIYREADQGFSSLNTQQAQWQQRAQAITHDLTEWQQRAQNATTRLDNLAERRAKITDGIAQLKSPDHVQEIIAAANDTLKQLEGEGFALQSRRTEATQARQGLDAELQTLQENLMSAREGLVRAETQFQNATELQQQLFDRCEQNLDCTPEEVAEQFGFTDEELEQNLQTIRGQQDRARNERDKIGAVNLRAEEEAETLGTEIEALTAEKNDIVAAIEKLRQGIATLNRDARKKMLAAFEDVNTRFRDTFSRLFNGGEAYLQLIDAEDPLEAGLEIYAQPPGKKLQTMTLLSGGEQSLTATALIFAMFQTNPSPICILDEIDAALDDANVERICSLLQDFAKTHPTRFLVITHNPIMMASLDRLYGVTMIEKGVSKLVSVDLENQFTPANQDSPQAVAAE